MPASLLLGTAPAADSARIESEWRDLMCLTVQSGTIMRIAERGAGSLTGSTATLQIVRQRSLRCVEQ